MTFIHFVREIVFDTLTHSHSLSLMLKYTHTLALKHSHTHTHTQTHTHTHTHVLSLSSFVSTLFKMLTTHYDHAWPSAHKPERTHLLRNLWAEIVLPPPPHTHTHTHTHTQTFLILHLSSVKDLFLPIVHHCVEEAGQP